MLKHHTIIFISLFLFVTELLAQYTIINRFDVLPPNLKTDVRTSATTFTFSVPTSTVRYISSPISSGRALYLFMEKYELTTVDDAKKHPEFKREVIEFNTRSVLELGRIIKRKEESAIIEPAKFENKVGWTQDAYMSLWIPTIQQQVTHIVMAEGWEYSVGASEEFLLAVLIQLDLLPRENLILISRDDLHILAIEEGVELLSCMILELNLRHLLTPSIAKTVSVLFEALRRKEIPYEQYEDVPRILEKQNPGLADWLKTVDTQFLSPIYQYQPI